MHWHRAALKKNVASAYGGWFGAGGMVLGYPVNFEVYWGDSRGGCINSMSDALPDWGGDVC